MFKTMLFGDMILKHKYFILIMIIIIDARPPNSTCNSYLILYGWCILHNVYIDP